MPVVPFAPTNTDPSAPPPPPNPQFALMAAAQMHSEGRLVKPDSSPTPKAPRGNHKPIAR